MKKSSANDIAFARFLEFMATIKPRVSKRAFARSRAAALTMSKHQADPPPMIIHMLRVLLDRESYTPSHAQWVEDEARALLKNWVEHEDLVQLKQDLGLLGKKRRKALTMKRETTIVATIVDDALADTPKKGAKLKQDLGLLQADHREVQRAWKKWGSVYIERLRMQLPSVSPGDRAKIRKAIAILNGDKK
jgi:hypothetical protein